MSSLKPSNMDTARLAPALTPETRAIVAVSILGNPAALDVIRAFADEHDLIMIEDNCESMDAELAGRKTGTFGDIGTFSTFFSHHVSTIEGGMLVTDDPELRDFARSIRAHGWTRDLPEDSSLFERQSDDFFEAYRFILPGYNVRPQEINAAVGIEQLKKLPGDDGGPAPQHGAFSNSVCWRPSLHPASGKMASPRRSVSPSFSIPRPSPTASA